MIVLLTELVSAAWFYSRSQAIYSGESLSFIPPPEGWKEIAVDPGQVGNVNFDRCRGYRFIPSPDIFVEVLSLEFNPGHSAYEETLVHPIKVCTTYSGKEVSREYPPARVSIGDQLAELESVQAEDAAGRSWFVFKAVWLHNAYLSDGRLSHRERIGRAFRRFMPGPPALILIASISGVPNHEKALRIFERDCLSHITRGDVLSKGS